MAEVTVNSRKFNVSGDVKEQFYNITIANTGDTLTVGLNRVLLAVFEPAAGGVTAYTTAAGTIPGQTVITLTSGAQTGLDVCVWGT